MNAKTYIKIALVLVALILSLLGGSQVVLNINGDGMTDCPACPDCGGQGAPDAGSFDVHGDFSEQ